MYQTIVYGSIKVFYTEKIDGGGRDIAPEFNNIIKKSFTRINSLCEFGAGPGFIGFSLLANNLVNKLTLIDINPEAIMACKRTIQFNHLEKKVRIYQSNGLSRIPSNERWDLVVSNPPHFNGPKIGKFTDTLSRDQGWHIHRHFYLKVSKFLNANGFVIFAENLQGSSPKLFKKMINSYGRNLIYTKTTYVNRNPLKEFINNLYSLYITLTHNNLRKIIFMFKTTKFETSPLVTVWKTPWYFVWSQKINKS